MGERRKGFSRPEDLPEGVTCWLRSSGSIQSASIRRTYMSETRKSL